MEVAPVAVVGGDHRVHPGEPGQRPRGHGGRVRPAGRAEQAVGGGEGEAAPTAAEAVGGQDQGQPGHHDQAPGGQDGRQQPSGDHGHLGAPNRCPSPIGRAEIA